MNRLIAVLALALATVAIAPRNASALAPTCTENYTECMNDSWMTSGWLQVMADVECFGDYVACVGKKVASF